MSCITGTQSGVPLNPDGAMNKSWKVLILQMESF